MRYNFLKEILFKLGKQIRLKSTPKLRFVFDPSLQKAAVIGDLIQQVNQETKVS